jgi:hypothetical protein
MAQSLLHASLVLRLGRMQQIRAVLTDEEYRQVKMLAIAREQTTSELIGEILREAIRKAFVEPEEGK